MLLLRKRIPELIYGRQQTPTLRQTFVTWFLFIRKYGCNLSQRRSESEERDVNPVGMEILLNKLKAGCFLEHWAESGATHSLPSCIMHTNMLFLCSARWIIAPSYCSSGFGLKWRDDWGKADSLSGLRCTPSHQADTVELSGKRLTEGVWTGSEAHLGSASSGLAAGKHVEN